MTTSAQDVSITRPGKLQTKFQAQFSLIVSGKSTASESQSEERFFLDHFCLNVDAQHITESLKPLSESRILAPDVCSNLGLYFRYAVSILKEGSAVDAQDRDDLRRRNITKALIPFMQEILVKPYHNYSFDVISILASSLDQSHAIFTDFVASLDTMLRDTQLSTTARHNVLKLCLIVVCTAGQASIVAYFLRRDFFYAVTKLITDNPSEVAFTGQALALIGVLANYHKENRNFYLVRLEDLVDEEFIKLAIQSLTTTLLHCRQEYIDIIDDSPPTFTASLTSLLTSLKLSDYLPSRPATPVLSSGKNTPKAEVGNQLEGDFINLPPTQTALLFLPFYDLLYVNKAFAAQLFDPAFQELPMALVSLSSYLLCHASTSSRAKRYGKLAVILLTLLVEDSSSALYELKAPVRICRQRQPMLPYAANEERPLLCAVLDCTLLMLRHNLGKKLDISSYTLTIKLIHKILHHLKAQEHRLEYDWHPIWRAILSLASFMIARWEDLQADRQSDVLVNQIIVTLDYACIWADTVFADESSAALLYFEILRSASTVEKLAALATPQTSTPSLSKKKISNGPLASSQSATNLKSVVSFFQRHLDDVRNANGGGERLLESAEVLRVIKRSFEQLSLTESVMLDNIRPYTETEEEAGFLKVLLRDAQKDTLEMLVL